MSAPSLHIPALSLGEKKKHSPRLGEPVAFSSATDFCKKKNVQRLFALLLGGGQSEGKGGTKPEGGFYFNAP